MPTILFNHFQSRESAINFICARVCAVTSRGQPPTSLRLLPHFYFGHAAVRVGEKWTFITTNGTMIHKPFFDDARPFHGDFAEVKNRRQVEWLSKDGHIIDLPLRIQAPAIPKRSILAANHLAEWYEGGRGVFAIVVFIGCWIYCAARYGFLWGVGFGWLPSMIVAALVTYLWPLFLIVIIVLAVALFLR